jgi:hypothetical protein
MLAALLFAPPAAQAAPASLSIASNGSAFVVTGTPTAGATTFRFTYTGPKAKGITSPAIIRLGPAATADQVLAGARALKSDEGPDQLLASTQSTLIVSLDEIPKGPGGTVTTVLAPGNYLILETAASKPAQFYGAPFTVPAPATAVAPLPAADATVRLRDYRIRAPRRIERGASVKIVNGGEQLHFVIALKVPRKLSDKAARKALRTGDEKAFRKSPAREVVGLISPGVTNILTPKLGKGRWILACFYANEASHGHPHSMLGMETVVKVR